MSENERDCVLFLDELEIWRGVELDGSSDCFLGKITLPESDQPANHALVFMNMTHCVMSTFSFPKATLAPSPQPSPQPSQQLTPEPLLQPSPRTTPSLFGERRRDDEANEVLRQTLYEQRRLADLTQARNRQDAAFQQSMLEPIREVADAVQASMGSKSCSSGT
ncbi:uncharacterized protein LOC144124355 [Amblyomma americanum]